MAAGELNRLRAEVKRARENATRKAARLRRDKGVRIGMEPKLDARRAPGAEQRYNSRQLNSYLNDLKQFNSRGTQFVAGAAGTPIRKEIADQLAPVQERFNASRDFMARRISNIAVPGTNGVTYGQQQAEAGRGYDKSQSPLARAEWDIASMEGEKGVQTAIKTMRDRMSTKGQRRDMRKARFSLDRMAAFQGDGGAMRDRFKAMSGDQILAFWSTPSAVNSLALAIDSDQGEGYAEDDPTSEREGHNLYTWDKIADVAKAVPLRRRR